MIQNFNNFQVKIPWKGGKKNYSLTENSGCMDFVDENSVVVRGCQEEDYCQSNPCLAFCDDRELFNSTVKWTPGKVAEKISEFQKSLDIVLNDKKSTHKRFDKKSDFNYRISRIY